jgi:hypothetical protein
MKQRRDVFQRKCAAARRMNIAMARLASATSADEKDRAAQWIAAWCAVAGFRQFPLGKPGRTVYQKRWVLDSRRRSLSPR